MNEIPFKHRLPLALASAVVGAAALGVVMLLAVLATIEFGLFDPSAMKQHGPIVSWAVHTTFIHATERAEKGAVAPPLTHQQAVAGFSLYVDHCQVCHGGWGAARAPWVAGINPTPPFLLDARRRWTAPELHRIVADGVKMTAMPAWRLTLPDSDIWNLVAFLETPGAAKDGKALAGQ